jgi:hypothetical protein
MPNEQLIKPLFSLSTTEVPENRTMDFMKFGIGVSSVFSQPTLISVKRWTAATEETHVSLCYSIKKSVVGLLQQRPWLGHRSFLVGFVVEKVVLGQVFRMLLLLSSASILPKVLRNH